MSPVASSPRGTGKDSSTARAHFREIWEKGPCQFGTAQHTTVRGAPAQRISPYTSTGLLSTNIARSGLVKPVCWRAICEYKNGGWTTFLLLSYVLEVSELTVQTPPTVVNLFPVAPIPAAVSQSVMISFPGPSPDYSACLPPPRPGSTWPCTRGPAALPLIVGRLYALAGLVGLCLSLHGQSLLRARLLLRLLLSSLTSYARLCHLRELQRCINSTQ